MEGFGEQKENTRNIQSTNIIGPQLLEKAVKLHQGGQIAKAETFYLQAIEAGFHHEIAFSNLGVIYKNTNRIKEATEIYKRAILSNPLFA
ncbi:tetratricopeptide repeat protein, partial [bacterium]|nr:tetratricopeptide repeat protein [bacterium]